MVQYGVVSIVQFRVGKISCRAGGSEFVVVFVVVVVVVIIVVVIVTAIIVVVIVVVNFDDNVSPSLVRGAVSGSSLIHNLLLLIAVFSIFKK